MNRYLFTLCFLLCAGLLCAQPLQRVAPSTVGMDAQKLTYVDEIIQASMAAGEIPGAVLAIVRGDKIAYIKAYGNKSVLPKTEPMTENTVFDLASVSKPVGTAISMMQLMERGKFRLTDPVSMYIPGFEPWKDSVSGRSIAIRIIDLLTHTSGLPAYGPTEQLIAQYGSPSPEGMIAYIASCKREYKPGTTFQYSCLNFITLQNILQNITGQKLSDYAKANVFDVLGMKNTMYNPTGETLALCAPTEQQADGSIILGKVHDPLARLLNGGNSGNAGVFSNAEDLAVLAAAMMNGGAYNGKRILSPLTVATMTRVPEGMEQFGRSLGWDNYSAYASNNGNIFDPKQTFGHTGYTGTSIIIDPVAKTAVILLAHRVHPKDVGSVVRLRALVANAVAGAIQN